MKLIGLQDLNAVKMRFEGVSMKDISDKIGVPYFTIRHWFSKGGRLEEYYKEYCKTQTDLLVKQARDLLKKNVKNASITLIKLLKSDSDKIRLAAADKIISREMGEPLKRIADEGDDTVKRILKEAGVIKEEDKN